MDDALLALFLSRATLSLLDEDERPLGEHAIASAYERAGIDERRCPYEDRRAQVNKPINAAALRQISRCWPEVLSQFERLASTLAIETGHLFGRALPAHMVWRVHLLASAGPALFKMSNPTRPIPRALSGLFKTSLGYASVLPSLLMSQPGVVDAPLAEILPEHDFFALLDQQDWLIGQSQVCAGSAAFIQRSYRAMTRARPHTQRGAMIYERHDLKQLSLLLAMTWARLLECALYTREMLGQGAGQKLDGYSDPRPSPRARRSWPVCVQLFRSPNAPQYFALPRAMPGLHLEHLERLFPAGLWSASPRPEQLTDIDVHMQSICLSLKSYFAPASHRVNLCDCLMPTRMTPIPL